jgi:demethylmenaquinone methyltransferase/2-methoxy-6-polyprenyl-1,4-benzoquinol methylase
MQRDDLPTPDPAPVHAPHPPLADYYPTEEDRQAYVIRIFDNTAADYDRIESLLALGTGSRYRREALIRGGLKTGMKVLDVGVGTGLLAAQACIIVGDASLVTGVDPSPGMLASSKVPDAVSLVEGRAESLPFPDNHFDFLSMGYALRHISDLATAFAEFERVLKPGGRLCVPSERVVATLSGAKLTEVGRHLELGMFSEYRAIKAESGCPVPQLMAHSARQEAASC